MTQDSVTVGVCVCVCVCEGGVTVCVGGVTCTVPMVIYCMGQVTNAEMQTLQVS